MVPPLGGRRRVLTPSLRVTDSRIQNLVLRRLVLFLWFSIVFQNNYGGDSQISFKPVLFFRFAFPVAIPVATVPTAASWRLVHVLEGPSGGPCFCLFLCFSCDCSLGYEAPMLQGFLHMNDLTFCCSSLVFRCN